MALPESAARGTWSFRAGAWVCRAPGRSERALCCPARRALFERFVACGFWRRLDGEGLHEPLGGRGEDLQDVVALLPRGRDYGSEEREKPRALQGPETAGDLHLDLHHPQILFGEVVGEGHVEIGQEPQRFGFELFQPVEQIVARALFATPACVGLRLQRGQLAVIRQAHPHRRPIALDEGLDLLGRQRPLSRLPRRLHRRVGLAQHRAHEFGPGFLFEFDQALEFAQDMGVAEGVIDLDEPVVGLEVVVDDDAAFQIPGDVAALFSGAIEGEAKARGRVQPLQLAADPIARLVEMADLLAGDALADPLVDRRQLFRLLAPRGDAAGRTDPRRAENVAHRLRGPILGDHLLDVHVDRRRLEALAILRRRDHAFGKRRLRHPSAMRAAMDRGLMFGHQQQALGKVEHLPPSTAMLEFGSSGEQQRSHARAWCRTTKSGLATRRRVSPAWPSWPPLALPDLPRRLRAARGFFFNPSLEGGFELFVLSSPSRRRNSATKASSSAIRRSLAASNSWISGGMTIPLLIQIRRTLSPKIRQPRPVSTNLWQFGLTTTWELRNFPSRSSRQ